ncbi:MAG: Gfo/Idh/MocA family protein [Cytophagaceae bacterium]
MDLNINTPEPAQRKLPLEQEWTEGKPSNKLGIAIVGLGKYSTQQLLPALKETKSLELKGLVSGSKEKLEKYAKEYNVPSSGLYSYDNFDSIKDNNEIDVVYIVLPNAMHAEYTIRAAKAGKHVICEKPMACSVEEAEQMIAACQEAGKRLFIGYRLHFEPYNLEAMRLGREKVFGEIKEIRADFGFDVGEENQWRLRKSLAGGGSLYDVGIYTIQAARYVTGMEPVSVRNVRIDKSNDKKFKEVECNISWELVFPNGIIAKCSSSYSNEIDKLYVRAKDGWFEIAPAFEYEGQKGRSSMGEIQLDQINQQAVQMEEMAKAIIRNTHLSCEGEEGLKDMKVIEAIYQAAEQDKVVFMEDVKAFQY